MIWWWHASKGVNWAESESLNSRVGTDDASCVEKDKGSRLLRTWRPHSCSPEQLMSVSHTPHTKVFLRPRLLSPVLSSLASFFEAAQSLTPPNWTASWCMQSRGWPNMRVETRQLRLGCAPILTLLGISFTDCWFGNSCWVVIATQL